MINKIKNYITENREYIDRDMTLSEYILINAENADDGFEFWLGDGYSDEAYNNFVSLINYNLDITIWEIYSRLYEDNEQYILDYVAECVDNELYNDVDKFETVKFLVDKTGCFDIDCISYTY